MFGSKPRRKKNEKDLGLQVKNVNDDMSSHQSPGASLVTPWGQGIDPDTSRITTHGSEGTDRQGL